MSTSFNQCSFITLQNEMFTTIIIPQHQNRQIATKQLWPRYSADLGQSQYEGNVTEGKLTDAHS